MKFIKNRNKFSRKQRKFRRKISHIEIHDFDLCGFLFHRENRS